MKNRNLIFLGVLVLFCAAPALAQTDTSLRLSDITARVKALKLTADEVDKVEVLVMDSLKIIKPANALIGIAKEQTTQALLKPAAAAKDVEPFIRELMDQNFTVRMAQIDRQLKIRAVLGNNRWAKLSELAKDYSHLKPEEAQKVGDADTDTGRILNLLGLLNT